MDKKYLKRVSFKSLIIDILLSLTGVVSASLGLKGFLLPNGFLDGGVTGISLLLHRLFNWDLSILIVIVNVPFLVLGFRYISKVFSLKALISIIALALAVYIIDLPTFTNDKLLIAIFGGLFLGAGIGCIIRGGAVIDGTEILAIYLSKRYRTTIGKVILIFNIVLFIVAALVINLEVALYSILTYIAASKTADYIIQGIEEYIGVTIISLKSEEIRIAITEELGYGATIYKGKPGYKTMENDENDIDIIHTIITRFELRRLHSVVENIDDKAFIIEYNINDTKGGMIKKSININ